MRLTLLALLFLSFSASAANLCGGCISSGSGGGGAAVWGSITGTLSDQTDLNTALGLKAPLASPTFTGTLTTPAAILSGLTATTVPYLNGSKALTSSAVTPTELGYLSGVSSALQTQLGLKAPLASPTFSGTTTFSALTATTVPYLDGSKVLTSSAVTPTELGYVSGVTSALQTQLGLKAPLASPTFTGTVTAPTISAGAATVALAVSTADNGSGNTGDMTFLTGTAGGGGTNGGFFFGEGNSGSTKGLRVYNRSIGSGTYTQIDYLGVHLPSGGTVGKTGGGTFFIGPAASRIQYGNSGYLQIDASILDYAGDTYWFGGASGVGIFPYKRGYFGTGGVMIGYTGAVVAPNQMLDVRGAAGASEAQFTNTATGSAAGNGALVGVASDGKGVLRIPATAVPATATDTCIAGTVAWDSSFIYVCIATNTWKRAAMLTW